jgi:hypothetical protein
MGAGRLLALWSPAAVRPSTDGSHPSVSDWRLAELRTDPLCCPLIGPGHGTCPSGKQALQASIRRRRPAVIAALRGRAETTGGSFMQVRPLRFADEFDRYDNFAHVVYRRSPHWVSPDRSPPSARALPSCRELPSSSSGNPTENALASPARCSRAAPRAGPSAVARHGRRRAQRDEDDARGPRLDVRSGRQPPP